MEEEITKVVKPIGFWYAGSEKFYAISLTALADEEGNPAYGFGFLVTPTVALNADMLEDEEVKPVHDAPVFAMYGAYVSDPNIKEIEVLNTLWLQGDESELEEVPDALNSFLTSDPE